MAETTLSRTSPDRGHADDASTVNAVWLTIEVDATGNKLTASGHYDVRFSEESVPISEDWIGEAYRMTTQLPAEATLGAQRT